MQKLFEFHKLKLDVFIFLFLFAKRRIKRKAPGATFVDPARADLQSGRIEHFAKRSLSR
jgi:hypothetical protein